MKIITYICLCLIASNVAFANNTKNKTEATLSFNHVVVPEAPPVATVMVAYVNITNNSNTEQTINKIDSPQFKRVEIHNMTMKNGMMNMQQLKTLSIKAKKSIALEPGGLHIMLIKPLKPLKRGDHVKLRFRLLSGKFVSVNTNVQFTD